LITIEFVALTLASASWNSFQNFSTEVNRVILSMVYWLVIYACMAGNTYQKGHLLIL